MPGSQFLHIFNLRRTSSCWHHKLTARAFAESPSVRMRVHCSEDFPPASLASSSLGMPVMRCRLAPSFFLSSLLCLKSAQVNTLSTSPHFATAPTMYSGKKLDLQMVFNLDEDAIEKRNGLNPSQFGELHER
jgi:hypothetical protein